MINKIKSFILSLKNHDYWVVFLISILLFSAFQIFSGMGDPDGFYHARLAQMMPNQLFYDSFPWMQYSTLNNNFTDHHFLYHLLLIPFVIIFNPLVGAKIFTVILSSLFILTFYYFIKHYNFKYRPWIIPLLFLFTPFFFRLSVIKATALSLIILMFLIQMIFEKKYLLIFLLSFLYVWSYGGWLLGLLIGIIYIISDTLFLAIKNKSFKKTVYNSIFSRTNHQLLLSILSGNLFGLIVNPYFPKNIIFYWQQIVQIGMVNYQKIVAVGNEWYPISIIDISSQAVITSVLLIISIILMIKYHQRLNRYTLFFFFSTLFFLLLTLKSRRYLEYYAPFSALFIGYIFTTSKIKLNINKKQIITFLDKPLNFILAFLIICSIFLNLSINFVNVKKYLNRDKYLKYENGVQFLKQHTPFHSLVFHASWDDWPALFYYNPNNFYIGGLDPTFTYLYDKELYKKWRQVVFEPANDDFYNIIKNDFKANYVFAPKIFKQFINNLKSNFYFKPLYEDEAVIIYQVL